MTLIIVLLLVFGYLLIATGHLTGVNKAAIAMFIGTVGWVVYICWGSDYVMSQHPSEYADFLAAVCYGGDGKLYAYANSNALDPDAMSNPYLSMTNLPVIIDLKAKTMRVIEGMEISNPHTMAIGLHQGLVVYGSSNKQANGFYTYDPKTQKVEGPVISVQGIPCFFHSFAE